MIEVKITQGNPGRSISAEISDEQLYKLFVEDIPAMHSKLSELAAKVGVMWVVLLAMIPVSMTTAVGVILFLCGKRL